MTNLPHPTTPAPRRVAVAALGRRIPLALAAWAVALTAAAQGAPTEFGRVDRLPAFLKHAKPADAAEGLLVAFHPTSVGTYRQMAVNRSGLQLDAQRSNRFVARFTLSNAARRQGKTLASAMATLRKDPTVRLVEPDYKLFHCQTTVNDPHFGRLWGLHNTGQTGGTAGVDVNAPEAWTRTTGSADVVVAVIDSGVDWAHPDLAANIWTNPREIAGNGLDDDRNGFVDDVRGWDFANGDNNPTDDHGHGTHCAGTIGAIGNNGLGVIGVSPNVRIMPLKFLTNTGGGDTSKAILAIDYARANGAHIMSNSWGGSGGSQLLLEAIQRAHAAGILFVAAAGNNASDVTLAPNYPASYNQFAPNVLSVGSITDREAVSSFSNYSSLGVDLCAPGSNIFSTVPNLADKDGTVDGYTTMSGTSMATPHVAGAAALVKALYPNATWDQIKTRLLESSVRTPSLLNAFRYGRLDAEAALEADALAPTAPAGFTALRRSTTSVELQWNNGGDDGSAGQASAMEVRVSETPIDASNWAQARLVAQPKPDVSGTAQRAAVVGLRPGSTVYFAARASDNVGNPSPLATAGPYTMLAPRWATDAEATTGFAPATGTAWGLSSAFKVSGTRSWTDSPTGNYRDNANDVLNFADPVAVGDGLAVTFLARQQMELNFDFIHLEVSTDDGATWRPIWKATGSYEWTPVTTSLGSFAGQTVRLRFRLTSDGSVNQDGFYFDDVALVPQRRVAYDGLDAAFNWTVSSAWGRTTSQFFSAGYSLTDSPSGTYAANSRVHATLNSPVSFGDLLNPSLQFMARMDLERGFDFMDVMVSPSGANDFRTIGAFTGSGPWQGYVVPMPAVDPLQIRFGMRADGSIQGDGVYLDDLSFVGEPAEPFATPIVGQLALSGYRAPLAGESVDVEVRVDGNLVETRRVTLDAQGRYSLTTAATGNVALSTKFRGYLRRTVAPGTTMTMTPGDVDDDNSVTVRDYSRLSAAYGTTAGMAKWDAAADVDGDGTVGFNDYQLIIRNYNKRGDK